MVQLGISYFFWRAIFASGNPVISGRNFDEFVLYLVLSTYMQSMMGYPLIYFISRDIRSGGILHSLLRPSGYDLQMIYKTLGTSLVCALLFLPLFLGVVYLGDFLNPLKILGFFVLAALGITSAIQFDFLLGLFTFWSENSWGIALVKQGILLFFSGRLFPVDMLGKSVFGIIQYSPFPGMVYGPIQHLLGDGGDFLIRVAIQLFWVLFFKGCIMLITKRAQKDVMIYGG